MRKEREESGGMGGVDGEACGRVRGCGLSGGKFAAGRRWRKRFLGYEMRRVG